MLLNSRIYILKCKVSAGQEGVDYYFYYRPLETNRERNDKSTNLIFPFNNSVTLHSKVKLQIAWL
jgi:hypothetical protein